MPCFRDFLLPVGKSDLLLSYLLALQLYSVLPNVIIIFPQQQRGNRKSSPTATTVCLNKLKRQNIHEYVDMIDVYLREGEEERVSTTIILR
ncbi:MAG: hypothetical protein M3270_09755 [Thermoproteota archaeon]|nr:hypothetical protein [Thermoproteota archaeon]